MMFGYWQLKSRINWIFSRCIDLRLFEKHLQNSIKFMTNRERASHCWMGKKSSSSVLAQALNQFEFTQPRDGKYFEVKCLSLESGLWLHSRFLEWVRACESFAWFDTKNEGKLKKYFDLIENRLYVKSIIRKLLKSVAKNQDKTQTVCEKQNKVVNDWTHSRAARSKSLVTRCM